MAWWIPILQAVGMNAAKNVVTGQDPLKGAVEAGVTGGVLGAFNPAGSSASNVSGVGSAPSGVSGVGSMPSGASGVSAAPGSTAFWQGANTAGVGNGLNVSNAMGGIPGAGAFEASMGLGNAYNAGAAAGLPGSGTIESIMGQAGADGVYRDPSSFVNVFGTPTYTGGEGLLSNAMGNIGDNLSGLGKYATPQNLIGVGSLLNSMDTMPRVQSSGGGVRGGGAVKFEPFVTGQVYTRKKRG